MKKLVAIVGMCGSGKSRATEYFTNKGWKSVYFGQATMNELERVGLPKSENNEREMREKLRAEHGLAAYAKIMLPKIKECLETSDTILDGLYSWSEYTYLSENLDTPITLLAIATDRSLRYKRLTTREIRPLTNEEARARDYAELEKLEKGGPIAFADRFILNNGTEEELLAELKKFEESL